MSAPDRTRTIQLSKRDLTSLVEDGIIDANQAERIWSRLWQRDETDPRPRFDLVHLLWYAGALIVMAAMGLFSAEAWSRYGGFTLAAITSAYAIVFAAAGSYLWHARRLRTPGGLLITVAVIMVPATIGAVQDALGWWTTGGTSYRYFFPWVRSSWFLMELGTLVAALVALRFFRFPFITMPLAAALWLLSIDLAPWLLGESWADGHRQKVLSLVVGLLILAAAWRVDIRSGGDFAFWLHLAGLLAAWGGLSWMESDSELGRGLYCLINVLLLFLSIFLVRRAYAVFGALGVSFYVVDLADRVFKDSLLFPLALSLVGIAVIVLGLLYFRRRQAIADGLRRALPPSLQALRPAHARE
ncbi:MAG TPA: DUF2157 domain-containing protein [Alphaproteobacteria bacterium]|nr:DUF2157 domain-containing protein [Alphaproteobacteria bacterium]